jgi:hypothetical protein
MNVLICLNSRGDGGCCKTVMREGDSKVVYVSTYVFPQNGFLPLDPVALLRSTDPCASFLHWGMEGRTEEAGVGPEVKDRAYLVVQK